MEPITTDRLVDILGRYINNDLCMTETQYVRDVLMDVCGMTREEITACGFDYIFPDDYCGGWENE